MARELVTTSAALYLQCEEAQSLPNGAKRGAMSSNRSVGRRLAEARESIELAPPEWIVELVRTQEPGIPWRDMGRAAISIGGPLAVGFAVGNLAFGVLISIGAMPAMFADRGGALSDRLQRAAAGIAAAAVGLLLGRLLIGAGPAAVAAIALVSLFAGLISPIAAIASFAGLQLLVYIAIGSGFIVPLPAWEFPLFLLIGGIWSMVLSTAQTLLEGISSPENDAVAAVYRAAARLLDAGDDDTAITARQHLTAALNTAYDRVVGARSRLHGRDRHLRWLGGMLSAANGVAEAAVAVVRAGVPVPPSDRNALEAVAAAVETSAAVPPLSSGGNEPVPLRALETAIERAYRQVRFRPAGHEGPQSLLVRVHSALDALGDAITTPGNWVYAIRVALCMAVAEAVRQSVTIQRPYWIVLTVAIIVKPDFGSVFARAVQRGVGTVAGVVLGAGLLAIIPPGWPIIVTIAVLSGLLPVAMRRNYGLLAIFITPLVVMLIDLATGAGQSIILPRVEATLIGAAIVLVLGYLLWPETWRTRVGSQIAASVDALAAYLQVAFLSDDAERMARRRAAYRALSESRVQLQRMLSEPPPVHSRAAAWWPVVNALERVTDAVTEAAVTVRHGGESPQHDGVEILIRSLQDIADSLRARRTPPPLPEIRDPALRDIRDEIQAVVALLNPEPGEIVPVRHARTAE